MEPHLEIVIFETTEASNMLEAIVRFAQCGQDARAPISLSVMNDRVEKGFLDSLFRSVRSVCWRGRLRSSQYVHSSRRTASEI